MISNLPPNHTLTGCYGCHSFVRRNMLTGTGESVLSRIVNWMIETKPIYSVMKMGAMNAMKSTTRKAGIDWDGHVRRMAATPEVRSVHQALCCSTAACVAKQQQWQQQQ